MSFFKKLKDNFSEMVNGEDFSGKEREILLRNEGLMLNLAEKYHYYLEDNDNYSLNIANIYKNQHYISIINSKEGRKYAMMDKYGTNDLIEVLRIEKDKVKGLGKKAELINIQKALSVFYARKEIYYELKEQGLLDYYGELKTYSKSYRNNDYLELVNTFCELLIEYDDNHGEMLNKNKDENSLNNQFQVISKQLVDKLNKNKIPSINHNLYKGKTISYSMQNDTLLIVVNFNFGSNNLDNIVVVVKNIRSDVINHTKYTYKEEINSVREKLPDYTLIIAEEINKKIGKNKGEM